MNSTSHDPTYSVAEHTEKISWLLDQVIHLPFAAIFLGFAVLGLYLAWRRYGKFVVSLLSANKRNAYLTDLHQSLSDRQEALLYSLSEDYILAEETLDRREYHIKELHHRLLLKEEAISTHDSEMEAIRSELDSVTAEFDKLTAEREQDEELHFARLKELNEELSNTGVELEYLRNLDLESKSAQGDVDKLQDKLDAEIAATKSLRAQLNTEEAEVATLTAKLEAETEEIDTLKASLSAERAEVEALTERLNAEAVELETLNVNLNTESAEVVALTDKLSAESAAVEGLYVELNAKSTEVETLVAELEAERTSVGAQVELTNAWELRANSLELENTEHDRVIAELRAQIEELNSRPEPEEEYLFNPDDVYVHDRLGVIYRSRPDEIDDLKEISGVASVLEEKLHNIGIYQFKQIAIWTNDQITEFGERLSFKDRIDRDMWVNQAVDLHFDKYSEHLAPQVAIYRKPAKSKPAGKKYVDFKHEDKALAAFRGEKVESHHRFGVIFTEAPADADDLKEIQGVGETLEKTLHKFGVYRFKQIAMWSPRVINEFVEDLPFGDRVTRDQWTEQALVLHEQKYGETAN